jgi:RecB family exonuclease
VVSAVWSVARSEPAGALARAVRDSTARSTLAGAAIAARVERRRARQSGFGAFDGVLGDAGAVAAISKRFDAETFVFSTRQLQSYIECPFQFFQDVVLGLDSPEGFDLLAPDHGRVGARVHGLLRALHQRAAAGADVSLDDPSAVEATIERLAAELINDLDSDSAPFERAWVALDVARGQRVLRRFARQQLDYLAARPVSSTETGVCVAPGDPALDLSLGSGVAASVRVHASVDRLDASAAAGAETIRLIDYKSGDPPERSAVRKGLLIELPLAVLAAEGARPGASVEAGGWGIKDKGYVDLFGGRGRHALTWAEWKPAFVAYLRAALEALRGGQFPVAPRSAQCESGCGFRAACRVEQVRRLGKAWREQPEISLEAGADPDGP